MTHVDRRTELIRVPARANPVPILRCFQLGGVTGLSSALALPSNAPRRPGRAGRGPAHQRWWRRPRRDRGCGGETVEWIVGRSGPPRGAERVEDMDRPQPAPWRRSSIAPAGRRITSSGVSRSRRTRCDALVDDEDDGVVFLGFARLDKDASGKPIRSDLAHSQELGEVRGLGANAKK